ncbi:hypothetical protein [Rhizorhabdus wittichii]|uniref:hypothetical protein n=1 Tax=Rhizorhabdus wittichii TaxID=160791 RepID=UPI00031D2357|nr:hypothetical protein [Rhizorhabdus wittichii]
MKALDPIDLISAHRWKRATLATYALSASFYEAVVVEALLRQGVNEIAVLSDSLGLRMALKEHGAVRIGREYSLNPIEVSKGFFHPKLIVLEGEDEIHALIGSANITFGGWSANLECIDHVDTVTSPTAMTGLADFFEALAIADRCAHEIGEHCIGVAARIRAAVGATAPGEVVRVVHSLGPGIAPVLVEEAQLLGGATSLTCVSPYWDAVATDRLARDLGLDRYFAHAPVRRVPAPAGLDWPRSSKLAHPVCVKNLVDEEGQDRDLHAKLFEVTCRQGRLILCGSANATSAGLFGDETQGNIEVCTLRIDRAGQPWVHIPTSAPGAPTTIASDDAAEEQVGVLVASHSGVGIEGRILTSWHRAIAEATIHFGRRDISLGSVGVSSDRRFIIPLDLMEDELSLEGRIQLSLVAGDEKAEGFVSVPDFNRVRARAGGALSSMLAALKQLQTPDDVLAILEFFRSNPGAFRSRNSFGGRWAATSGTAPADPVIITDLVGKSAGKRPDEANDCFDQTNRDELAWQRLMARLLASIAKARPQADEIEDDEDPAEAATRKRANNARSKLDMRFPGFFHELSQQINDDGMFMGVLRMTQFVSITTGQDYSSFLERLVQIALQGDFGAGVKEAAACCTVYLAAKAGDKVSIATARSRLLSLGIDPAEPISQDAALPGLLEVIAPSSDLPDILSAIASCRTIHEEIRALEAGLSIGQIPIGLDSLTSFESWPKLKRQLDRKPLRRVYFVERPRRSCPKCNMELLHDAKTQLARHGVCEANCHGFILARNSA